MADGESRVRRTLHLRFTFPSGDRKLLAPLVKAAAPFYEMLGRSRVRLLQNVDDPSRFVQVIDYEMRETVESNRQRLASDPKLQAYLQAWRAVLPGAGDLDVFEDITDTQ
ncbi:MAG: hypothetical protein HY056_00800 [Proteobacteria bacterium]|nr:hypothetical protein [Pseudomonadota bacterium]